MPRRDGIGASYRFLTSREQSGEPFSLDDLCGATGWKLSTAKSYLSKNWRGWVEKRADGYRVSGVAAIGEDAYRRHMSQVKGGREEPSPASLHERVERLVLKARQSALLALDVYNRPSTQFRTEGYIVLMIVAWTAALHAIFERDGIEYFHQDEHGDPETVDGQPKTWAVAECVRRHFGNGSPPVRENLEFIIGLRNAIEHRYAPGIDAHVAGECQALLLNLERLISDEFGDSYSIGDALSVPLQTSTLRGTARAASLRELQRAHYEEVMRYVEDFRSDLPDAVYADPAYSFRVFLIPKIGNHRSSSDAAFEFVKYDPDSPDDMAALQKQVALIRDRQVPVANQGRYRPKRVAEKVAERLGRPFRLHHHTLAWKYYDVRAQGTQPDRCKTEYCQFDTAHGDYVYTDAWVDFLIQQLSQPDQYEQVTTHRPPKPSASSGTA